ncbi:MAG: molybdopterin oxidoreductase family protein [Candidatus Brocadiaceae bacterium]|nr:molybdopterin oxidoreductase family protein [Candidatus Brocadiaceae bacterium]
MSIQWKKSTCPYCGLGCGLMVGVEQGKIVKIHGMKGHPVNNGDICILAAELPPVFNAEGRLRNPMIRRDGELVPVTWDEAITHVAKEFMRIVEKYGPSAVAFYGGASNLDEEYYLINKLMKGCIGANNIECSTRLCMVSSEAGFVSTFGADAPPTCYADVEEADLFFIAGNNMAVSLPILFRRICAAKEKNAAKVIVVDPRQSETAAIADIHLQIRTGTDVALNNALAHVLIKEGLINADSVEYYTSGFSNLKELLEKYPPSRGAEITGCAERQIVEAARLIGHAKAMLTLEVFEELKILTRGRICDMSGVTYERLRGEIGPQLPCPDANHPGTPRLFTDRHFPREDGRTALLPREYIEPAEISDNDYPFVLITGRLAWHFNTRTRTGRIPQLNAAAPDNIVEIHTDDARRLGIAEGDEVEITSRRGKAHGIARLTDRVLAGTIYMNFHYGKALWVGDGKLANLVCNPVYDIHSKQP